MANLAQQIDDKLAKRIAATVRLLASDKPGEAAAALQALGRVLQGAGADAIHAVADRIEHPLTEEEMKKIFEAGVARGLKQAKREARINGGEFPSNHDMAMWCRQQDQKLNDWERKFINDMAAKSLSRALSLKQEEKLRAIFLHTGGPML
jgi:hypothetical protein